VKYGKPEWRKQKRIHPRNPSPLKCIGASDDGKTVMVRYAGAAAWTMNARDWESLPMHGDAA